MSIPYHLVVVLTSLTLFVIIFLDTLSLHMNDFTGEMPIEVCDFVKNGDLEYLWADCSGGNNAKVVCSCCSQCF